MQIDAKAYKSDSWVKMSGKVPSRGVCLAIEQALTDMVSSRRYSAIRVQDLCIRANVSRSTFYEHFSSKDAVLVAISSPMLDQFVIAARNRLSRTAAREMFRHLWAMRGALRTMLAAGPKSRLHRELAARIISRWAFADAATDKPLLAEAIAAGQLAMIELWISGRAGSDAGLAADQLLAFSAAAQSKWPA